jgi:hypothetical protein
MIILHELRISGLMELMKEYHGIFSPLLRRREQRGWMEFYLQGLLSPEMDRKSIEPMVLNLKAADENAARTNQQFIGEGGWKDDRIRRHCHGWGEVNHQGWSQEFQKRFSERSS